MALCFEKSKSFSQKQQQECIFYVLISVYKVKNIFGLLSCAWQRDTCLPLLGCSARQQLQVFPRLAAAQSTFPASHLLQVKLSRLTLVACSQLDLLIVTYDDNVLYLRQSVPRYDSIGSYLLFQVKHSHGSLQIRETSDEKTQILKHCQNTLE